ncbi:MAG: cyclase family protein [Acidobacteriota bacterium]
MKWMTSLIVVVWAVLPATQFRPAERFTGKLVDLTHAFDRDTIYWPTEEDFRLEKRAEGITSKGYYYAANKLCTAEHGGTHIDAPVHFHEGGHTTEKIPLERLIGAGALVDVSARCEADPDYQVQVQDLLTWEKKHHTRLDDHIVLLKTGFAKRWPDRERYLGTARRGEAAVSQLRFPGLHPEAAKWLAGSRSIRAVGLDTASIDYGKSSDFKSHIILFEKNIPALENLANLDGLPEIGFTVVALPMKIRGGTGGPLRIVAIIP